MDALKSYLDLIEKVDHHSRRSAERLAGRLNCGPGCTDCCRHIAVFPVEAVRLALALQDLPADRIEVLRRRAGAAEPEGACPLLDPDGRCALYAARPVICRTQGLPLLIRVQGGEQITGCPRNDLASGQIPAEAIIDLERLNEILATINRLFVQHHLPGAPQRLPLAAALQIELQ